MIDSNEPVETVERDEKTDDVKQTVFSFQPSVVKAAAVYLLAVVSLLQFGIIAGLAFRNFRAEPTSAAVPPAGKAGDAAGSLYPNAAGLKGGIPGHGEDLIRAGNYERALSIFQIRAARAIGMGRVSLQYREALCLEGMGRWEEALERFRSIVGAAGDRQYTTAAQTGQARIWLRAGKPQVASRIVYRLLLRSADAPLQDRSALADIRYLAALSLGQTLSQPRLPGILEEKLAVFDWRELPLDDSFSMVKPVNAATKKAPPKMGSFKLQKMGDTMSERFLTANLTSKPVTELLEKIAKANDMTTEWSSAAKQYATDRTVDIVVHKMPLQDVITALSLPARMIVTSKKDSMKIVMENEATPAQRTKLARQRARRALNDVVLAHPGHSLAAAAHLETGNLEASQQNYAAAQSWYLRVVKELPPSNVRSEAHYNLGLTYKQLGDVAAARAAFYRVVDGEPGGELAPFAALHIGRMYLAKGMPQLAVSPLRRALEASIGSAAKGDLALNTAATFLLLNKPQTAHAVLLKNRLAIRHGRYRAPAAVVDALARYRIASPGRLSKRDGQDLLAALLNFVPPEKSLGAIGTLLAGQSYLELDIPDKMAELFEANMKLEGPIGDQMKFRVAEFWKTGAKRSQAEKLLRRLAADTLSPWAAAAQKSLAEMALNARKPRECLQWCRLLMNRPEPVQRPETLKLMGQAYQLMGDLQRASVCFSGQVPNGFTEKKDDAANPPSGKGGCGGNLLDR